MPHIDIHGILQTALGFFDVPAVHDMQALLPSNWTQLHFEQPWFLWGLIAVPFIAVLFWKKRQPAVTHTRLPRARTSLRGVLTIAGLVTMCILVAASTGSWITALAHPDIIEIQPGGTVMARDISFAIDISQGNMDEDIGSELHTNPDQYIASPDRGDCKTQADWGTRKIDAAAYAACRIGAAFPNDRKALATFSGSTQCCTPALTTSQEFFDQRLRYVNRQFGDSDTNFEDDQGVFHTLLDFMKLRGKSKTQVLIIITDGDGTLTDEHIQMYANYIKDHNIFLVCGGPGDDTVATDPDSDALVKVCDQAGALRVNVATEDGIQQVIDAIRKLPPTSIKLDSKEIYRPVHEGFILFGFITWALAAGLFAALGRIR